MGFTTNIRPKPEVFMSDPNAPLSPEDHRRLGVLIVDRGWSIRRTAERIQVSAATASKWAQRCRAGETLTARSSRPLRSPNRLAVRRERRIIALRFIRQWGPHRIGHHLGMPRSTVGRVLARYRMQLLAYIDQATGLPVRKPKPIRYEMSAPGQLVHVDIKNSDGSRMVEATGSWGLLGARTTATATRVAALPICSTPWMTTLG